MQKIKDFLAFEGQLSLYCLGVILGAFAMCSSRMWAMWITMFNGSLVVLFSIGVLEAVIFWVSVGRLFKFVLKQANAFLKSKGLDNDE